MLGGGGGEESMEDAFSPVFVGAGMAVSNVLDISRCTCEETCALGGLRPQVDPGGNSALSSSS